MSTEKKTLEVPQVHVERRFDAATLNTVVNDPAVYPWVHGAVEGPLDLTAIAGDPQNVLLQGEFGSMLFMPVSPGIWELHTQVLPEGRGPWTLGLGRAALLWMFTATDAVEILTRVPEGNVAAASAAKRGGFAASWTMAEGWFYDGKPVPVTVYSLTLQGWLAGPWCTALDGEAERFNAVISEDTVPLRGDARRPLGFALAAIRGHQPLKGCAFLNRWGGIAGFPAAGVAQQDPLVISLGGALFTVSESGSLVDLATLH